MHIVFAHTLIWNCRYHRHLRPSFTLNSTTATQSTLVFPALNLNVYNVLHAPSSKLLNSHSPPLYILKSLHWLKINERIEYKLISVTYKVLTTSQPTYLSDLISVQPPHLYSYFNCRHFSSLRPSEQGMGRWVMGHGSNGSRKSDGSHGSWVMVASCN